MRGCSSVHWIVLLWYSIRLTFQYSYTLDTGVISSVDKIPAPLKSVDNMKSSQRLLIDRLIVTFGAVSIG